MEKEGHNSLAIANRFVKKAVENGRPLDILQLVKLVYLAHGWCLGYTGKPLLSMPVQAWRHGPVPPEVYHMFRPQGIRNITRAVIGENGEPYKAELSEEEEKVVDRVFDAYSPLSGLALSNRTHAKGTPWDQTSGYYAPISDELIRDYYKKRVEASGEIAA